MRKLVFGMSVVFCVQICFQVLMSVNISDLEFAAMSTPLQTAVGGSVIAQPDAAALDMDIATGDTVAVRTKIIRSAPPRTFASAAKIVRSPLPSNSTVAMWKPIEITYRGPASEASTFDNGSKAPPKPKSEDDKKSLFAKALPVIKKPYDWLKAIGSKLK